MCPHIHRVLDWRDREEEKKREKKREREKRNEERKEGRERKREIYIKLRVLVDIASYD